MRTTLLATLAFAAIAVSACTTTKQKANPMQRALIDWDVMMLPAASSSSEGADLVVSFMTLGDANGFPVVPLAVGDTMTIEPIGSAEGAAIKHSLSTGKFLAIGAYPRLTVSSGNSAKFMTEVPAAGKDLLEKSGFRLEFTSAQTPGESPRLNQFAAWRFAEGKDHLLADLTPDVAPGLYRLSRPISLSSNSAGTDEHFLILKIQSAAAAPAAQPTPASVPVP